MGLRIHLGCEAVPAIALADSLGALVAEMVLQRCSGLPLYPQVTLSLDVTSIPPRQFLVGVVPLWPWQ